MRAACHGASTQLKRLFDLNGAIGGPLKRDKLWFFATSRYFTNEFYLAGRFFPADVTAVRRTGRSSQQAFGGTYTYDNNGRVTWAINEKQKISGFYAYQYKVDPHWLINVARSPEAARVTRWHTQLSTTKWTYTATNRLLFEAGVAAGASPDTIKVGPEPPGRSSPFRSKAAAVVRPLTYRAPTEFDWDDRLPSQSFNVSASYVTGTHNAKFGFDMQRGHFQRERQQRLDRRHLVPDARLRAEPRHHPGADLGMAEQSELQPGPLRAGPMDGRIV